MMPPIWDLFLLKKNIYPRYDQEYWPEPPYISPVKLNDVKIIQKKYATDKQQNYTPHYSIQFHNYISFWLIGLIVKFPQGFPDLRGLPVPAAAVVLAVPSVATGSVAAGAVSAATFFILLGFPFFPGIFTFGFEDKAHPYGYKYQWPQFTDAEPERNKIKFIHQEIKSDHQQEQSPTVRPVSLLFF